MVSGHFPGKKIPRVVGTVGSYTGKKAAQQFVKHSIVSKHLVTTKQIAKL
jgi:hypothetical protein